MGTIKLTKFAGLVTAPGLLERNEASCIEAVNWEFPAPGVMRKRRGFQRLTGNTGGPAWKLLTSRLMGASVLAHIGTGTSGFQLRHGDGTAAMTTLSVMGASNLTRTAATRMQMAVCQRNHYVTATEGTARIESDFQSGSSVRFAGMPRGQGPIFINMVAGTNIPNGFARAYRVTWHRKDADGVELGGAPTGRFVASNTSGLARSVALYIQIPREFGTLATPLTTSYFWRLWGNRTYLETDLGDDEMYLIGEGYLEASDISSNAFAYTDTTPNDFLLGAPTLHTNVANHPSGEAGKLQGVVNEDAPPPVCNDVCYWQDVMWFADCLDRPSITANLVTALVDGDTVTVTANGVATVVTARTVPGALSEFQIVTSGATAAINIRQTVMGMVRALNVGGIANGFSAHHVSTTSTQPGLIFIELVRPGAVPLVLNSSVVAKWRGVGGYSFPSNVIASPQTNLLRFSKPLRADAVPPINALTAGPADSRILRIMPLGDRLIVFTDYGIYQVTGRTFADFAVFPFDLGFRLMGREHVAMCDEKLYAWCNEGIVEIDDGGVRVISTPIEPTIEAVLVSTGASSLSAGRAAIGDLGFTTAYRNQHQVRFHYPEAAASASMSGCAYWLSFDTRTRAWAQGQFSTAKISGFLDGRACAVVRLSDDLLVLGNWSSGADTFLFLERRAYAASDFIDTTVTGVDLPSRSSATFQYQVPDESGAQHWQQTVLNWDAEEISWRALPVGITLSYLTEDDSVLSQTVVVADAMTRIETPPNVRRAQRLQLRLFHQAAEYAGVVGVSQTFRSGSRFARRVTP